MSDLINFAQRVNEELSRANRQPHWEAGVAEQYMTQIGSRRERFAALAVELIQSVIQPRLEVLAARFPNASPVTDKAEGHCCYWFGFCERFPSSTKVTFSIEHDVRFEKVAVCYHVSMVPLFIRHNEHDKLTLPLEEIDNQSVANWVEERLIEFIDVYLQIDRGSGDFADEVTLDPVCGMRIGRSSAAASDSHRGHPYFFCSKDCHQKFTENPIAFVTVKTLG